MAINITNDQYRSVMQNVQNRYIRIELLNQNYQTVNQLEGICTDGSISINADSDMRRSGSVTLIVNNSDFEVTPGGQIWLNRFVRVWVGIEIIYTKEIIWTNCGIFIVDAPSYSYDPSTNTLQLSLLDLMAKLTGVRDGYLVGLPVLLSAGENIREAIIDTLALGGFTRYLVEEAPSPGTIPTDIELSQGSSVYDIISALVEIYPLYTCFFDINGVFHYEAIPSGTNDPVQVTDDLWSKIVLSEDLSVDFQNVKNSIEVYGRTHDPAHFSTSTSVSGNTISLTIDDVTEYTEDMIYGFTLTDNPGYTGASLRINNLATYPLRLSDGTTAAEIVAEESEIYYCVQFKGDYWYFMGHLQAYASIKDEKVESPFSIDKIGEIHLALFDSEYANILDDDLAYERCEFELYLHSYLNNSIQLTCVPVYWLDVNILVEYTLKRNGQTGRYVIKSITMPLSVGSTMSLSLMQFIPQIFSETPY